MHLVCIRFLSKIKLLHNVFHNCTLSTIFNLLNLCMHVTACLHNFCRITVNNSHQISPWSDNLISNYPLSVKFYFLFCFLSDINNTQRTLLISTWSLFNFHFMNNMITCICWKYNLCAVCIFQIESDI